ncbi:Sec-independent protein translocase protein TatB [Hyphomicrobium sp.]|uniref:Sec-independent protein translocase protein TatB n=1 Tax=Hyphomicrobium sp. TaxID=82 RepID=UPI003F722586
MFDVSWSELLILGVVTLIFVGPKELPRFLNTLGRYLGVVRRQANEFRAVFEQAMREAEMDEIQKEVRAVSEGVKASLDDATRSVESVKQAARLDGSKSASAELPKAAAPADLTPDEPKVVTSALAGDSAEGAGTAPAPVAPTPAAPTPAASEHVMASEGIADEPEPSILPPGKTPDKTQGPV